MGTITAAVYDGASPATKIADLPDCFSKQWLDLYNDVGSGSLQLDKADAVFDAVAAARSITHDQAKALVLAHDNIVRFAIDGTDRFAFIIGNHFKPPAPQGERSEEVWTLAGRGVLAILDNAIVEPELLGTYPTDRSFGWMSMSYDDSAWGAAVEIQRQDDTAGTVTPHWITYPLAWPDKLAWWIWSRAAAGSAPFMPVGTSYFRKSFTLADDTICGIFATCDDVLRLWIDDEVIFDNLASDVSSFGFHDTTRIDRTLKAGTHVLAVEAVNLNWTPSSNFAGFICSVIELDPGHGLTTNIILRSDSSWVAKDYPTDPPGMPIGQILRELVQEAQARGALVGVTLDFTDTLDTKGATFAIVPDLAFQVGGTSLLAAANILIEQFIDLEMTPALVLRAYNKGTLGSDLTVTVSLEVGRDFELADTPGDAPGGPSHFANALLVRDANGVLTERDDAASLATRVRRETYVELGTAPSSKQAQRAADALLDSFAVPAIYLPAKVTEESGVYTTYTRGDVVLGPGLDDAQIDTTVMSIAVSEVDAGNPIFDAQLLQDDPLAVGS